MRKELTDRLTCKQLHRVTYSGILSGVMSWTALGLCLAQSVSLGLSYLLFMQTVSLGLSYLLFMQTVHDITYPDQVM